MIDYEVLRFIWWLLVGVLLVVLQSLTVSTWGWACSPVSSVVTTPSVEL